MYVFAVLLKLVSHFRFSFFKAIYSYVFCCKSGKIAGKPDFMLGYPTENWVIYFRIMIHCAAGHY